MRRASSEGPERAPQIRVRGGDALRERCCELVLLPLEGGLRLALPCLEALLAGLASLREPLREDRVGLADEHLDGAVELP